MNDAQTWTVISGLLVGLLSTLTFMFKMLGVTVDAKLQGLEARLGQEMGSGFARMERRIDRLEARVDGLDRDVTALTRRGLDNQ